MKGFRTASRHQRATSGSPAWWERGVIYQIYVRSFADSEGNGIGDLRGVIRHLDYLNDGTSGSLGVDAIWLTPFYPSPNRDFGYDVSDYTDVDPLFGSLDDFDQLVSQAHRRGMRVLIDWVPNHTSDEHPWFIDSRSSRRSRRRNWYVWRDPAPGGGPPNNWQSTFANVGPAWTFDPATDQWYLHSFSPHQPDLNWDEPAVERAMHEVLRFWLERGVDGFRVDVAHKLGKDPELRDNPARIVKPDRAYAGLRRDEDWPSVHRKLGRIRSVVEPYGDRVLVGEVYILDQSRVAAYLNAGDGLHLAHNFALLDIPWNADAFRSVVDEFESHLAGSAWPTWFLNNHDHSRVVTRYDQTGHGVRRARLLAMFLLTVRGTPFLYQGEELGLADVPIPPGLIVDIDGRDSVRSPMPWAAPSRAGAGAGFTDSVPWLPVTEQAEDLNVETQSKDHDSMLALYRRLIRHRKASPALQSGSYRSLGRGSIYAYLRENAEERVLVLLNFVDAPMSFRGSDHGLRGQGRLEISTVGEPGRAAVALNDVHLEPLEGRLIRLRQ